MHICKLTLSLSLLFRFSNIFPVATINFGSKYLETGLSFEIMEDSKLYFGLSVKSEQLFWGTSLMQKKIKNSKYKNMEME